MLLGGAALVALSLALPHPSGGDTTALIAIAALMAVTGILCLALFRRIPLAATHAILAAVVAATGLLIYESGVAAGQYGSIFVWATLISGCYFQRRVAAAHLLWLLARAEILARHDALTGLPNRRSLDELLPREMARARRAE